MAKPCSVSAGIVVAEDRIEASYMRSACIASNPLLAHYKPPALGQGRLLVHDGEIVVQRKRKQQTVFHCQSLEVGVQFVTGWSRGLAPSNCVWPQRLAPHMCSDCLFVRQPKAYDTPSTSTVGPTSHNPSDLRGSAQSTRSCLRKQRNVYY